MNIEAFIDSLIPAGLAHLKALVGKNSFTSNPAGIDLNAQYIIEMFRELGFSPEWIASENEAFGNHLFLSRGDEDLPILCLVSHLDTVYSKEEEVRENFVWREDLKRDRIFGPGTVDIKGGTMAIWILLKALVEANPTWLNQHRWLIAFNASEEVLSRDFGVRVQERAPHGLKAALVFEGGPQDSVRQYVVNARKGRMEVELQAIGKSAHAGSNIKDGRNAIVGLSELLVKVDRISESFEDLSLNIATIEGGTVLNRVPHEATARLEMRAFRDEVMDQAFHKMEELAFELSQSTEVQLKVVKLGRSPGWAESESTQKIYRYWEAAGKSLGFQVQTMKRGGLSDANYLHHLGPTLDGLGPSGGQAHNSQSRPAEGLEPEYIEVSSIRRRVYWNYKALSLWLDRESSAP